MAGYPYLPQYNPYLPQTYQYGQNPLPQQQTQTPATSGIIWVSGLQEAQMYPVVPNSAVALWEQSGKVIYLKTADATGKPSVRIYDLVERTESAQSASSSADVKTPAYVTKEELSEILAVMKGLTGEVEQIKGDLYGISGRKRTSKKAEASDDDE